MGNDSYLKKGLIYSIALHLLLFIIGSLINFSAFPSSASSDMQIWEFDLSDEVNLPKGYHRSDERVSSEEQKFSNAPVEEDYSAKTLTNMADDLSIDDLIKSRNRFDKSDLFKRSAEETPEIKRLEMRDYDPQTEIKSKYLEQFVESVSGKRRDNSPFLLEGDVLMRQVLSKKIPEYPKNIRKNAKVTLEFQVNPNGTVSNIIVLKKAFPEMETISIKALKEWKFNAVGHEKPIKGKITFIYQVN